MGILDEIVSFKRVEVEERVEQVPIRLLERSAWFASPCRSLKNALLESDKAGIITEFKRRSPSKGLINGQASVEATTTGYVQAGAIALSILTDLKYFGGTSSDLTTARERNSCPVLRKDFIISEYQVTESKAIGADVILLIAAALSAGELKKLCSMAHEIGLEVLLEVHNRQELESAFESGADLIGVNNRDLKTFRVNLDTSRELSRLIPGSIPTISESGIESPESVLELSKFGFGGFLIGQTFMQSVDPAQAARNFIQALRKLEG